MADNSNNSSDDANERPQDWEMLSLSSLADSKPSGDASSSDDTDGDAVRFSTGSCNLQSQGIPDDQVHSKYYELSSSALSENSKDEKSEDSKDEKHAVVGGRNIDVGDSGTAVVKDGVEGIGAELLKVDWMEPSPLLPSTIGSASDEACRTVLNPSTVKKKNAENWRRFEKADNEKHEDLLQSEKAEDWHQSETAENKKVEDPCRFAADQPHTSSKVLSGGYSSTPGTVPIFEGEIPGEDPQIYSCLDNEEAECLAGIEREILAESEYTYSETFDEAYTELRAEDVKLISDFSSKSTSKKTWWKQQVEFLGVQVSQVSALWSLALAAAVMGLVILGQRWQNERLQNQQLRLQLGSKDEKINQLIFQISRLKDVVSGRRRVPVIRS